MKKISIAIALMIFIACVTLPKTAEEWLEKGQVANKAGNYDEAIKCFMKAVAINPNDANAHYNLGSAYLEKGKDLNSLAADYLYKAGLLFLKQSNKEWALKAFKDLKLTNSKEQEQDLYKKLHPEQADTKVNELIDREKQMHLIQLWREINPDKVFQNKFLGISTVQHPLDVWITQEIISEVKPDLIIEAGTGQGGSALLWALFLENTNPNGRVITIDIEDWVEQRTVDLPIAKRRVDFLLGSSIDPEIVAEVSRRAKGKKVLVILDSLHTKEHVLNELKAYSPLVSLGSYIIVQDTTAGPNRAIMEFLSGNDSFLVDHRRERFVLTNNVAGYLMRVDKQTREQLKALGYIDDDLDGIPDQDDNCLYSFNPEQEDTYPPGGNRCGDACECIGNLDRDEKVGMRDILIFNQHFRRKDCTQQNPCNGDFDCDGDVDDDDLSILKENIGRSGCAACEFSCSY